MTLHGKWPVAVVVPLRKVAGGSRNRGGGRYGCFSTVLISETCGPMWTDVQAWSIKAIPQPDYKEASSGAAGHTSRGPIVKNLPVIAPISISLFLITSYIICRRFVPLAETPRLDGEWAHRVVAVREAQLARSRFSHAALVGRRAAATAERSHFCRGLRRCRQQWAALLHSG